MIPAALTRENRPRQPRRSAVGLGVARHSVLNLGWLSSCGSARPQHQGACCRPMSLMPR